MGTVILPPGAVIADGLVAVAVGPSCVYRSLPFRGSLSPGGISVAWALSTPGPTEVSCHLCFPAPLALVTDVNKWQLVADINK